MLHSRQLVTISFALQVIIVVSSISHVILHHLSVKYIHYYTSYKKLKHGIARTTQVHLQHSPSHLSQQGQPRTKMNYSEHLTFNSLHFEKGSVANTFA